MGNEKFRDRLGFLCGHQQIDIKQDFVSSPITSRNLHLKRFGIRCQIASQCLSFIRNLAKLKIAGMSDPFLDRFANFSLRCFAKTRQFRHPTCFASLAELLD